MEFLSTSRRSSIEALLRGICAGLICLATSATAQSVFVPGTDRLDPVVVTAKRQFDAVADEKMKGQVEEALHSDAFFYDAHVIVTIKNGVATLRGIVFDDWDLRQAMRISKRVPGVKRVVNDLELELGGE